MAIVNAIIDCDLSETIKGDLTRNARIPLMRVTRIEGMKRR